MLGFRDLAITGLFSFVLVLIMGPIVLPALHRFKFGQTVRDDGPQSHLKKNGTPTMGGVMIIAAILLVTLIRAGVSRDILMALLCMFGFGLVGFFDDIVKIKMTRSLGLTPIQKIIIQVV